MSFFSAVKNETGEDNVRTFAEAISQRPFAPLSAPPLLNAAVMNHSGAATTSTTSTPSFIPVPPSSLLPWLNDPTTLVVDIRPPQAYTTARLPRALSLSVPSTLLKRPNFSLERLIAMLPSATTRSRFNKWHTAARIIVYDADSAAIPDHSNIHGLLRKFRNDSALFTGDLAWVVGGFQAVWRDQPRLIDNNPPSPEAETEDDEHGGSRHVLRARDLPISVFASAAIRAPPPRPSSLAARIQAQGIPSRSRSLSAVVDIPTISSTSIMALSIPATQPAYNPFFDTIRQNTELSHGITERIALRLPRRVRKRILDLPFRWLQDIARKADPLTPPPLDQPDPTQSDSSCASDSDNSYHSPPLLLSPNPLPDPADVDEGTEALAMQFYRIELAEQRRLIGVMDHHSKESDATHGEHTRRRQPHRRHHHRSQSQSSSSPPDKAKQRDPSPSPSLAFPFSITAGVEKGTKNRYRYIWPFEHARVRLHQRYRRKRSISSPPYVGTPGGRRPLPSSSSSEAGSSNIFAPRPIYQIPKTPSVSGGPVGPILGAAPAPTLRSPRPPSQLASFASSIRPLPSSQSFFSMPAGGGLPPIYTNALSPANVPILSPTSSDAESEYDDYVNASYVQPLGTSKRYIATQGPLPATYMDFWTLVWEQDVHVIVMLTRQVEGGMVKCGPYWTQERFGPIRLKLVEESGVEGGEMDVSTITNPFEAAAATASESHQRRTPKQATIRRVFDLWHTKYPIAGTRRVVQLQYLEWSDMNVPDEPRDLLGLVWQVEKEVEETAKERLKRERQILARKRREKERDRAEKAARNDHPRSTGIGIPFRDGTNTANNNGHSNKPSDQRSVITSSSSDEDVDEHTGIVKQVLGEQAPVLLHCSAGVGRTGGFIAVDAVLDGVRRELKKNGYGESISGDASASAMGSGTGSASGSIAGLATRGGGSGSVGGSVHGSSVGADRSVSGRGSGSGSGTGSGNVADRSAGDDDRMDVDRSPGEVHSSMEGDDGEKVPSKAGGVDSVSSARGSIERRDSKSKKGRGNGKTKESSEEAVSYAVGSDRDVHKTPMQMSMEVDEDEDDELMMMGAGGDGDGEEQKTSTRRWVETVLDETGAVMEVMDETSSRGSGAISKSLSASPPAGPTLRGQGNDGTNLGEGGGKSNSVGSSCSEDSFGFGHRRHHHESQRHHYQHHPSHSHLYGSTDGSGTSTSLATSVSAGSGNGSSSPSDKSSTNAKEPGGGTTKASSGASKLSSPAYLGTPGSDRELASSSGRRVGESDPNQLQGMDIDTGLGTSTAALMMGQTSNASSMGTPPFGIGGAQAHGAKFGYNAAGIGPSPLGPAAVIVGKGVSSSESEANRNAVGGRFRSAGVNLDAPRMAPRTGDDSSRSASTTSLAPRFGNNAPHSSSSAHSVRNAGNAGVGGFPGGFAPAMSNLRDVRATSVLSSEDEPPPSRSLSLSPSASGTSDAQYKSVASKLERLFDSSSRSTSSHGRNGSSSRSGGGGDVEEERRGRSSNEVVDVVPDDQRKETSKDDSNSDSRPESTSPPGSRSRSTPPSLSAGGGKKAVRTSTVDYKEPRPLHGNESPPPLSSYEDPVCEVVQDMREQRMSLCQTLRQYVFVHAAIIEGALMIVDEEREKAKNTTAERSSRSGSGTGSGSGSPKSKQSRSVGSGSGRGSASASGTGSGSTSANEESGGGKLATMVVPSLPATPARSANLSNTAMTWSPSTGKRGASPTELLKEDKKGAILLSKRPSLKRKQTGSD